MGIFKRAHVRGVTFELVRRGLLSFPSEKIADEVADAVADNLAQEMPPGGGEPEGGIPEITGEEGLTADEAAEVIDQLVDVAEEIAQKTGGVKDASFNKLAASISHQEAASLHAIALIEKAAAEEGTIVTGDGRFQDEIMAGEGQVDAEKNPSSEVTGPPGTTDLDTSAGAVGAEKPQDEMPGATDVTPGEVAKLSSLLRKLSQDTGTSPGSGDTGSTPYKEPATNVDMSGVAPDQGMTTQPKGPMIGEQQPQPAKQETSPETPGEVAKLSSALSTVFEALKKSGQLENLPPELKEKAEEKKEESSEGEGEKKEENGEKKKENGEMKEENGEKNAAELLKALRIVAKHLPDNS